MLYDIESERWYNQSTSFENDELPEPRTRFCGALVRDEDFNSNVHGAWEYVQLFRFNQPTKLSVH